MMEKTELTDLKDLVGAEYNPRRIGEAALAGLQASMERFGDIGGIVFNRRTGRLVSGHQRVKTAKILGLRLRNENGQVWLESPERDLWAYREVDKWPVRVVDWDEATEKAANLTANNPAIQGEWTADLEALLGDVAATFEGFEAVGLDGLMASLGPVGPVERKEGSLVERFGEPPFTLLDARSNRWIERKRGWLALGLESEEGREELLTFSNSAQSPAVYKAKEAYQEKLGREVSWAEFIEANPGVKIQNGTSIFDPVLCELVYRWFCPDGGLVLDPFAGGSVRGVVAERLGRRYVGVDLRPEQVAANRRQAERIGCDQERVEWIEGDSREVLRGVAAEADLVFSCPPYADLEVYSDDPRDLSRMDYEAFLEAYRTIIREACSRLKEDRFACFVVGDVRDKDGNYRNFVPATIAAFQDAGLRHYNEAILVTPFGSLASRAGKQFEIGRKLGKAHQNVLVFVKGSWRAAVAALGDVEFGTVEEVDDGTTGTSA